jgi:uncharacterized tellurite resistance protein B-like protein
MFDSLHKLFADLGEGGRPPEHYDDDDYRLAAAALLVHAAGIDGSVSDVERAKLHAVIKQRFDLDDGAADALEAKAAAAEKEAIDLYHFTARLNRSLDAAGRARMVEMLWQIVCADGVITEFEDNLVWRAADLLGISRDERIALKERVMASRAGSEGDQGRTGS